jgi:para-aminobenzoate synthetase/4-amino-4-deoxychorismate lyase
MRRILEMETTPRGVYCGAIGHLSPGAGAFNVAIRTVTHRKGIVTLGSGGGVVWDSEPEEEYRECLLKSRFLTGDVRPGVSGIRILETLLWKDGFPLRDRHLDRLTRTAAALGFRCRAAEVVERLEKLHVELAGRGAHRIRVLLDASGEISIESAPAPPPREHPLLVSLSEKRIDSANPFLRWKTTFRAPYEAGRREARRRGLDEVLFLNERGELTEGAISNVFLRLDGRWCTPPLSSGVLPGIGRELELESDRKPEERILYASDLTRAERVCLTNAVRGRQPARYVAP